jgi:DNA gyrase subunit A
MIASNGIIIRIFAGDISTFSRPAKGVRVMRVAEGEKILSVGIAEHNEAEVNDKPEEADADAGEVDTALVEAENNQPDEEIIDTEEN